MPDDAQQLPTLSDDDQAALQRWVQDQGLGSTITNVEPLASNQVRLSLGGGVAGRSYDVLRSTNSAQAPDTWSRVGSVQPGETWIDLNPTSPNAFYIIRDPSP